MNESKTETKDPVCGMTVNEATALNSLGSGMTGAQLDMRLRYEFRREFAPYFGVRYQFLVKETDNITEAAGRNTEQVFFLLGLRFAF